jgi:hypothetical protein
MSESPGFGFGLGRIKDLQEAFSVASQIQENAMNLQNYLDCKMSTTLAKMLITLAR